MAAVRVSGRGVRAVLLGARAHADAPRRDPLGRLAPGCLALSAALVATSGWALPAAAASAGTRNAIETPVSRAQIDAVAQSQVHVPLAPAPSPRPTGSGGVTMTFGLDRIAQLVRQIRVVQAQLAARQAELATATAQYDQLSAQVAVDTHLATDSAAQLKPARRDVKQTAKVLEDAQAALKQAQEALTAAQKARMDAKGPADDALARSKKLTKASSKAADQLAAAAAALRKSRSGKGHAFSDWQMTAVAESAAVARQELADDLSADLQVTLEGAQATQSQAELAQQQAAAAQAAAEQAAQAAAARRDQLTTNRDTAAADLERLAPLVAQSRAAKKQAARAVGTLSADLADLQARAAAAMPTPVATPSPSASTPTKKARP